MEKSKKQAETNDEILHAGTLRARTLGNRGPIRFNADGSLDKDIVDAYWRCGFYVFEGALAQDELADIEAGFTQVRERLPITRDSTLDSQGRPAITIDNKAPTIFWSKPLGDPLGGTAMANGRHPVKMREPTPDRGAPDEVVYVMLGHLQFSDAFLRLYANPNLLKVVEAINGEDFTPFNEALFIKEPGLGASVAWHQDGVTHWDNPDFDQGIHGFNLMAQIYGCTAANALWVVPGSHKLGKVDIAELVAKAGTEYLPDAVPLICEPGDVVITNRQAVHGSFANTSADWRVTVGFGFHRRTSVLNVTAGGVHNAIAVYDAQRIHKRSEILGYAIDARRQRFPDEVSYEYKPHNGEHFVWDEKARAAIMDYNLLDLSI